MAGVKWAAWLTGAAWLLAGCAEEPAPPVGGFTGAQRSDAAMLMLPDGCVTSFVFPDFTIRRQAALPERQKIVAQGATLIAPAHMAGEPVNIDMRVSVTGRPGQIGALEVEFAGTRRTRTFTLEQTEEGAAGELGIENANVFHRFVLPADEGENVLIWRIRFADSLPADAEASLSVDTADVLFAEAPFCPTLSPVQAGEGPTEPPSHHEIPAVR